MALVTLATARKHLRPSSTDEDSDVLLKLSQAEAIVLDYLNTTATWRAVTVTWTDATVPRQVEAAILLVLTHLYENRGDNMAPDAALWEAVRRLVDRTRDPVLA